MIGKEISHYKILSKLGEGGMGVVYRAHHAQPDRDIAVKSQLSYVTSLMRWQVVILWKNLTNIPILHKLGH